MTATAASPAGARSARPMKDRIRRFLDRYLLSLYAILAIGYLLLPVAVIALFSFNDPIGRSNLVWNGFTLEYWKDPFGVPGLGDAVLVSIRIALLSTLVSAALGTLIALALVRYQFRASGSANLLIFLPMATPEIVLGASLLTMFVAISRPPFFPLNESTILVAHIMFNISFVVVTVRARLSGLDRHLEEAAMDLGATELVTFWKITFPLILPGIVAASLLAFSLSIDDFVITNFTAGRTVTFPMFVWGAARIGIPVQVNVIGTAIFVIAVGLVALSVIFQRRRERPA
jgi:spermidine/putrescine transport system permease protein